MNAVKWWWSNKANGKCLKLEKKVGSWSLKLSGSHHIVRYQFELQFKCKNVKMLPKKFNMELCKM